MTAFAPKYFCPLCRAGFEVDQNYCGQCGANMRRASRLARAELEESAEAAIGTYAPPRAQRRSGTPDPWIGRVVDGRYRVVGAIGRGGMGVVYKIEHRRMGKIAAMKLLHSDLAGDPALVRRFHREAQAVSRLTHPNSVQVFDFGETQGSLYLVMEYIRGRDLGHMVERDGPLALERAAPLFLQVADALGEAHELGIIHRDLKPENVLVTRTQGGHDFVKVLDFGLAKLTERDEVSDRTSQAGSIVGTPYTMSPEQIRGEPVDARSDLYSLGALMYRVLTGENAFEASTPMGVLTKHITEPLVPPSQRRPDLALDSRVDAVVARAMEKSPDRRYRDVAELAADLDARSRDREERAPGVAASITGPGMREADAVDDGLDSNQRLRRADVDAFERGLRRRRWLRRALLPLLFLAAVTAGIPAALQWKTRTRTEEVEPNHRVESATPIASGVTARGRIGKRLSRSQADRDFYAIRPRPESEEEFIADVRVTGLPNMAIQVALYEPSGSLLAHVDEGEVGEGEHLRRRIRGPFYILVTESRPPGALPTENVSDAYEITATLEAVTTEREPPPTP